MTQFLDRLMPLPDVDERITTNTFSMLRRRKKKKRFAFSRYSRNYYCSTRCYIEACTLHTHSLRLIWSSFFLDFLCGSGSLLSQRVVTHSSWLACELSRHHEVALPVVNAKTGIFCHFCVFVFVTFIPGLWFRFSYKLQDFIWRRLLLFGFYF